MPQLEVMPPDGQNDASLTLADMARKLDLAESTARYYCKRFAPFIPVSGEGRRRRYTAEALEVMGVIAENMTTLRSASAVEEALERRFPRVVEAHHCQPARPPHPASMPVPSAACGVPVEYVEQQTRALQVIALTLNKISAQQDALRTVALTSRNLVSENRALKRELQDLKELLRTAEKVHQEDLQQIRDWMGRILRKSAPPQE